MRLFRDVREGTKLLLLLEVTRHRHTRLKTLADRLDLTVARVSEYVSEMGDEGLIVHAGGEYRATKKGVDHLQANMLALRDFVESSVREMAIIDRTVALAGEDLKEGDRVGLFMEKGVLVARKKTSPSTGVAATAAARGDPVLARGLEGIVELRPGKVSIARFPPIRSGGSKLGVESGRKLLRRVRPDVVAAVDLPAKAYAAKLRLDCLIEFAVVPSCIEAAQRGLNVLLLCPEDRVAEVVAAIEATNERTEDKIPYETLNLAL